jgi:MFS family permease
MKLSTKTAVADAALLTSTQVTLSDARQSVAPLASAEVADSSITDSSNEISLFGLNVKLPPSLRALRHRNFRLFWTGYMVSLVGTWMQQVARGWLVLELTHSPFWLGMVGFANAAPVLFLSLWAGEVADRVSKRVLVIWTQILSMLGAFALAVLAFTGVVQVWHVMLISVFMGVLFAFDAPARQAFTVELVGKDDLMNAVALNSAIFNGARVAGPAIGAVALAWQGPALAFFLNGLSFIAVIVGLLRMNMPRFVRAKKTENSLTRIIAGLSYVRHHETISTLMILIVTTSVFAFPYAILMPIFADVILHVGKEGYGTLMAVSGVGSLVGALSLTVQSGRNSIKRGRLIMIGSVGLPLFLGVFAFSQNYLLSLAMLVGVGWTMISVNATINTVIQTSVPDELRGRVSGVFAFLFIGMAPLGNLQSGLIADHFGAPVAIGFGAAVCALVALFLFVRRRKLLSLQ